MGTSSNSITAQRLGFALSSVLLLQCVCMTLTFLYFHSELKQVQESFSKNNMACLTEDILHLHAGPKGDEEFYVDPTGEKTERNEDLCWKFRAQIQQLIEKTISNQYEQDMSVIVKGEVSRLLPSLTQSESGARLTVQKIAAHLTGNYKTRSTPLAGPASRKLQGQKIRNWEPQRGLAFLHSVEYKDGELIVPKTGLYYIYGQTYFRYWEAADSSPADSLSVARNAQMVQYIYKNTAYPEPILLMKNTRTICWAKNREYELHSIYQGGVFQLNYRDRIFVTVSNVSWVDMAAGSSFFGAFLVS
ncbi:LOW QUALITY PROTEIN: tumor necrosis factor ligand superfamily member 10-like [Scyliorhinus canicula]|uniref:LOW QUALITY PROTEIN: tumor necrosis factor ligand superfamily member 10-like n=1 Tax=Scyliorhinus canicula TaxID=7830 RepID=UPI0018F64E83|nr:LOW QUALITY PROTEIN: tumor necrosis factor ligand superfamily member 10-like [Scyliorhinus canicula]